jgi:hypothetical protein
MPGDYYWDLKVKVGRKGGPGSGHWGHAGRPGKVGGSAPGRMAGSGRVNRAYFDKGPGKDLIKIKTPSWRQKIITALTDANIQPRHLAGLTEITADTKGYYEDDWANCRFCSGFYAPDEQSIHLNMQKSYREFDQRTLIHELGHHITLRGTASDDRFDTSSPNYKKWLEVEQAYFVTKEDFDEGYVDGKFLANLGLRKYSMKDEMEWMADIFKVHVLGSDEARANLAEFLVVDDLEDLF